MIVLSIFFLLFGSAGIRTGQEASGGPGKRSAKGNRPTINRAKAEPIATSNRPRVFTFPSRIFSVTGLPLKSVAPESLHRLVRLGLSVEVVWVIGIFCCVLFLGFSYSWSFGKSWSVIIL
jgi:hypothetical protein